MVAVALAAVRLKRMGEQHRMQKQGVENARELRVRAYQRAIARMINY